MQYPNGSMDVHNKEEEAKKLKSRYNISIFIAATQTPSKQRLKSRFLKNDASKKETVHKRHRRSIINYRFLP
jgi:pantothenate kinase